MRNLRLTEKAKNLATGVGVGLATGLTLYTITATAPASFLIIGAVVFLYVLYIVGKIIRNDF